MNTVHDAAARLLAPQDEQGEESTLEQESPEEAQEQEVLEDSEVTDQEETEEEYEEEPEAESDDDDGEEEEGEQPEAYRVKVDGEEYEVNLQELIKGYQLEKNTTKKSQKLEEERKQLSTLKAELESQRNQYLETMQALAQEQNSALSRAQEQLRTIDRDQDPIGYLTKQAEVHDIQQGLEQKVRDFRKAQEQRQNELYQSRAQVVEKQKEILAEKLDGWNDPEKGPAIKEAISTFAIDAGYTQEELQNISDARDIIVLNKARLYDEQQKRREATAKKKAPAKPGVAIKSNATKGSSTQKARVVKDKRDKLRTTGKPRDAADLMVELMQRRSVKK